MSIRSHTAKPRVEKSTTDDIASKLFSNLAIDTEMKRAGDDMLPARNENVYNYLKRGKLTPGPAYEEELPKDKPDPRYDADPMEPFTREELKVALNELEEQENRYDPQPSEYEARRELESARILAKYKARMRARNEKIYQELRRLRDLREALDDAAAAAAGIFGDDE